MPVVVSVSPSLKLRVFACLNRLGDRDTYAAAAQDLEAIARGLEASSIASFVSCVQSTDASDRSAVRKHCVKLLSVLAESHGDLLAPHLNKILSAVVRRLRDPDSAVRSACVSAVESLRRHVAKPPFVSFLKPLADALFTEQDQNSQIGAALCLSAAIEAESEDQKVESSRLAKLLPRLEKLLKSEGFKAKPAVLALIGSAIGAGAVAGEGGEAALRILVPFLSSEDWSARKAAAESLARLAVVERDFLSEFKAGNLKTFESRRFDKVKVVREVINKLLEVWKQIPDVCGDISQPLKSSISSSKDNASSGRFPPGSKNHIITGPESRNRLKLPEKSTPPDSSYATTARKRLPLKGSDNKASPSMLQKKKYANLKAEISVPDKERDDERRVEERSKLSKPETRRALFQKNSSDDKAAHKLIGGLKFGSRVAPILNEEIGDSSVVAVNNAAEDIPKSHVEWEDLSLIRNQLVQIEKQQSSLMDLLQRFIGTSQNGMRSLETRVHGLELALDEISYDLAVSSGRVSKPEQPFRAVCCMPGADFLTSKFWRRSENRLPGPRIANHGGTSNNNAIGSVERRTPLSRRFRLQGGGLIVNPLAEIRTDSINQ